MPLDSILRRGVAIANRVTNRLQDVIQHSAQSGQDIYGNDTWADPVSIPAVIELKQQLHRTESGETVLAQAKITILQPVAIDAKDRIALPDGTTGPIVDVAGVLDPTTNRPYATEVWLGYQGR
jgi:hypothetical protein